MKHNVSISENSSRPVAIWIGIGIVMLLIQVILGGVTRLTGSGLSITEWNVITGTLPPMNEAAHGLQSLKNTGRRRSFNC